MKVGQTDGLPGVTTEGSCSGSDPGVSGVPGQDQGRQRPAVVAAAVAIMMIIQKKMASMIILSGRSLCGHIGF